MIRPATYNMYLEIGRDFNQVFYFQDTNGNIIDLSGYTANAQMRPSFNSDELLATFHTTISGTAGTVELYLTDEETLLIDIDNIITLGETTTAENAVYDLMLTDTLGKKYNYVKGTVTIEGTATR